MVGMSTSPIGGRTWSGVRGTSAVGWPRPTIGGNLSLSSNWAVAWYQPEVLRS